MLELLSIHHIRNGFHRIHQRGPLRHILPGSLNRLIRHAAINPACRAEQSSQLDHLLHVILSY